ncbi:MAG: PDZ domain-containing protein [Gemmatimonadetes bacterium]|nr:PDZ domain-containing protein [Gemmatimonadota bacterium]
MLRPRRFPVAVLTLLAAATAARAQEPERRRPEEREERCVCIPDVSRDVSRAMTIMTQMQSRARLGVAVSSERNPATDSVGARVQDVLRDSPAEEAGLREGDIIVLVNGRSLLEPLEDERLDEERSAPAQRLVRLARELEPGDTVRIVYRRDDERREATVAARRVGPEVIVGGGPGVPGRLERRELGIREPEGPGRFQWRWEGEPPMAIMEPPGGRVLGLRVVAMNPGLGEYFGSDSGVLITEVERDSPLPLRPGDVIVRVGGREVKDPEHLRQILRSYRRDETVALDIVRKRERTTVEGRVR